MNQHRLDCASVTDFLMQRSNKTHMPEKSEVVVDKATDVEHPGEVCELKGGRCAKLFGLGTRRLSIVGYPVSGANPYTAAFHDGHSPNLTTLAGIRSMPSWLYSVSVYTLVNPFKGHMSKHRGKTVKQLSSDTNFLADFKDTKLEKEVRLVTVNKKVTKDKFWSTLETRIAPQIAQDQREKDLMNFKTHFDNVPFRKGMDVRFALSSDGSVTTVINGTKKGTLTSKPISKAIVDIYLGKDPPSPALKSDFLSTAAALLARE